MEGAKVLQVTATIADLLRQRGCTPMRDNSHPNLNHLLWMCTKIPSLIQEERLDKAMRWLGFLQGALWALEILSVEESKRLNMPEGATFQPERV